MNAPCRLARRSSTSTATTSGRAVAGRPSPPWCACWRRSAIAAPAVRTAISRMVRQGWLLPVRLAGRPWLPADASRRSTGSTRRPPGSTAPAAPAWDGHFDLVVLTPPEPRADRSRRRRHAVLPRLRPAGPGHLGRPPPRRRRWTRCSRRPGSRFERFTAAHAAGHVGAAALVRARMGPRRAGRGVRAVRGRADGRRWPRSPDRSGRRGGVRRPVPAGARLADVPVPRSAAAARPAARAVAGHRPRPHFFDRHEARLRPAADRFVDHCLVPGWNP